jgi:hypothetical protein
MHLRNLIMSVVVMLCHVTPVLATQALTIKPEDVYQAGYCAELSRLVQHKNIGSAEPTLGNDEVSIATGYYQTNVHSNPISDVAYKLISGGDNLDFVELGIEDARQNYLELMNISGGQGLSSVIQVCADMLTKTIQEYEWMPCGYGRNRYTGSVEIKSYLQRLEIFIEPIKDTESALVLKRGLE